MCKQWNMRLRIAAALALIVFTFLPVGADAAVTRANLFPFVVNPWEVAPTSITNVAHWLDRPAGKDGFVHVQDGSFYTAGGKRIRFLGVNFSYGGNFPEHADATKVAQQLARFGINLVRIHHMDRYEVPDGIWKAGASPREIDPTQLDRLDYFIAKLKEYGIYTNLNLKVARTFTAEEGFAESGTRPTYDKGIDLYYPDAVQAQQRFISALLTHQNPYTGNRYINEPAIAQLEITNENGLFYVWQRGELDSSPKSYQKPLDQLWLKWLQGRYRTTEALRQAWGGVASVGGQGSECLDNGDFKNGTTGWQLQQDSVSKATIEVVAEGPLLNNGATGSALKVQVTKAGAQSWIPQLLHADIKLKPGKMYRVGFWLKGDGASKGIRVNTMVAHSPYTNLWGEDLTLETNWKQFQFQFRVPENLTFDHVRITFTRLAANTTYWIAGVSVSETVVNDGLGLLQDESLEVGVSRPTYADIVKRTQAVQQDYVRFLWDTDEAFFKQMYSYIKDELGAKSLVAGTQVPQSSLSTQAGLDYIDIHYYWKHAQFPGSSWDDKNWYIQNLSMVNADGGTITGLAGLRVAGKPFMVSEYNHPAPNTFGSETLLLAGAYGAFQDWDGIDVFDWTLNRDYYAVQMTNYFNIKGQPIKLVTLPAAAALLVRGDVVPGATPLQIELSKDDQLGILAARSQTSVDHRSWSKAVPTTAALERRVERTLTDGASAPGSEAVAGLSSGPLYTTDTGELKWDRTSADRSVVVIDTNLSKAVVGYNADKTYTLSGLTVKPGPTMQDGWSAISFTVVEGESFHGPAKVLITATGYCENTGMEWKDLGVDNRVTLTRWGSAPTLVEGIPAQIELPATAGKLTVYALDGKGDRRFAVPVTLSHEQGGIATFSIGPEYKTLWYELVIEL